MRAAETWEALKMALQRAAAAVFEHAEDGALRLDAFEDIRNVGVGRRL